MVRPKNERTLTAVFDDHEVITPPNRLVKAIKKVSIAIPGDDPVERAEVALDALSEEFTAWMIKECERLDAARHAVKKYGFGKKTMDELFHAAHDIKGDSTTFGYPVVAPAAESLCRVLEYSPEASRIPIPLIDQHVDAIRAMVREYTRPDAEMVAQALIKKLWDVSAEYLKEVNKDRPEYIGEIQAPPLAPNGKGRIG
jgi:chemotaxis protein histidine kinase CheA